MSWRFLYWAEAVIFAASPIFLAAPARGQPPQGKGPPNQGGPPLVKQDEYLKLLTLPRVQQELEILDFQQEQFRKLEEELRWKVVAEIGEIVARTLEPEERALVRERLQKKESEWRQWLKNEISRRRNSRLRRSVPRRSIARP